MEGSAVAKAKKAHLSHLTLRQSPRVLLSSPIIFSVKKPSNCEGCIFPDSVISTL